MSLIEQLGGYERAKAFLNATSFTIDELIMMQRSGLRTQHVEKALLEYRRQHNVYEADDLVVFVDEKERKPVLLKFKESRNFDLVHLEIIGSGLCGPSYQKEIRHATDEEIKAGKRLEVKSEN